MSTFKIDGKVFSSCCVTHLPCLNFVELRYTPPKTEKVPSPTEVTKRYWDLRVAKYDIMDFQKPNNPNAAQTKAYNRKVAICRSSVKFMQDKYGEDVWKSVEPCAPIDVIKSLYDDETLRSQAGKDNLSYASAIPKKTANPESMVGFRACIKATGTLRDVRKKKLVDPLQLDAFLDDCNLAPYEQVRFGEMFFYYDPTRVTTFNGKPTGCVPNAAAIDLAGKCRSETDDIAIPTMCGAVAINGILPRSLRDALTAK